MDRCHWVLDNLNTHWSLAGTAAWSPSCAAISARGARRRCGTGEERRAFLTRSDAQARVPFHAQARQLAQSGRTLVRGSRSPVPCTGRLRSAEDFEARLRQFLDDYNDQYAHPYRWTYTGEPLVRDTPFSRTRRQEQHGRASVQPSTPKIRAIALLAQTLSTKTASMTGQGLTERRD